MFVFHCDSSATVCVCVDDGLVTSFTGRWFTQLLAPPTRCSLWKLLFSRWPDICSSASHICLLTEWPRLNIDTPLCVSGLRSSVGLLRLKLALFICHFVSLSSFCPPPRPHSPHSVVCRLSQLQRIAVPEIYIYIPFIHPNETLLLKIFSPETSFI